MMYKLNIGLGQLAILDAKEIIACMKAIVSTQVCISQYVESQLLRKTLKGKNWGLRKDERVV